MKTSEIVEQLKERLGEEGLKFFLAVKAKYGTVNALWVEGDFEQEGLTEFKKVIVRAQYPPIPHPVHFREGMWVRNRLREITNYAWTDHEYDDRWAELIELVIKGD